MTIIRLEKLKLASLVGGLALSALSALGQASTFTYQGQLASNGTPATGLFEMRFALFNHVTTGSQVGSTIAIAPVGVTNGLFAVDLTFGANSFDGSSRWLEISVRASGSTNAFTTLTPRQALNATPYAIRAASVSGLLNATNLTGKISDTNLSVNVPLLTNDASFTRTVTASNFVGNGIGLTNLATTNLIGIVADAQLSVNVPRLNAANNVFQGGVTAASFTGHGGGLTNVPGRIFEVIPTGSNIQALANTGYLATNDNAPVVVTLPPTGNIRVGETVRVSASGAAGWTIAQNANQSILIANLLTSVGASWTTNDSQRAWKAIAASSDGSKMVAAVSSGPIYTSGNYGATWTPHASSVNWSAVASSGSGIKLAATVAGSSYIYTSGDSGANWSQQSSSGLRNWTGIASSLDGTRLVACAAGSPNGGLAISVNSGATWTFLNNPISWSGVGSSADGMNLIAVAQGGPIYVSNNGGTTWTNRASSKSWTCATVSADGSVMAAGSFNGDIQVSTDFGRNWMPGALNLNWSGIACSADGGRMVAVANNGGVYLSNDSGATWLPRNNLGTGLTYTGTAMSADGATVAAVASAGYIYVSSRTSTTVGVTGALLGARLAAVELQHIGNGVFIPISFVGNIRAK